MGVDAEELIIRPFRDVVARGSDAVANAETAGRADGQGSELSDRVAKAGRAVMREGERALARLQPVWDAQVEKYGDAFKDALMQQGLCAVAILTRGRQAGVGCSYSHAAS